jgi:hypothetical protein
LDIYRKKVSQIVTSKKVLKFQQKSWILELLICDSKYSLFT